MTDLNYTEILDRIKVINNYRVDKDLAKALSVAENTLSTWRKRNRGEIEKIIAMCDNKINLNWLISGIGEKYINAINNVKPISSNLLPLIPISAIAGISNGNDNSILSVDCEYYEVPEFRNKADYLIRINGSSMSPKYHSGDIVACKKLPLDTFFQWNKVYVLDTEQGALVKRVKKSQLGIEYIQLISENEKYEPFDIPKSAIHALGLVIGVIRLE